MFLYLKLHIDFLATWMADKHLKEAGAHPALTYYVIPNVLSNICLFIYVIA